MIQIGLLGLGNVGTGVINILEKNATLIEKRLGSKIKIKSVLVRDPKKARNIDASKLLLTEKVEEIINDPEIDIIVEVMGGEKPAYDYICQALANKKYVVTANKEVFAKHKAHFIELAKDNNVDIFYEASVGGGIPIIHTVTVGYAANEIQSIFGILNGTTNYILTKMEEKGLDFNTVVKQAQELGFAEADPTMDINGQDAAYKLNILAAIAFNVDVALPEVSFEGIQNISIKDIKYAEEFGYRIKLLAIGKKIGEQLSFKVHPTMIPTEHPLAAVRDEFNALYLNGDAAGEAMIYGKGAGSLPTGSAVLSDIMDIAYTLISAKRRNYKMLIHKPQLIPVADTSSKFYLRLIAEDTFGVLEKIAGICGKNKVSLLKVLQNDFIENDAELVLVTHLVKEKNMQNAIAELSKLKEVKQICSTIRVGLDNIS